MRDGDARCGRASGGRAPRGSAPPMSPSSAEVASSSSSSGASLRNARAMAMRWRCPPDRRTPRSPTIVSRPSGSSAMNSLQCAARAACQTSSSLASGRGVADVLDQRAVEQRDVLRHDRDGLAQALLRDLGDVLAVDQDAPRLDVVEALEQREDASILPPPEAPTRPTRWPVPMWKLRSSKIVGQSG